MSIHQEREEEFFYICQNLSIQKPSKLSVGVYFSLGENLPCGGGGMLWFEDFENLMKLAQHLPYMNLGQDPAPNEKAWNKIKKIVADLDTDKITLRDAIPLMDKALEPVNGGLAWWGYLSNLCEDDTEYAKNIRSDFWESRPTDEELEDDDRDYKEKYDPIPEELKDEFAVWISELDS